MQWKILPLVISFLVSEPFQAAHAKTIEDQSHGPTCGVYASGGSCFPLIKIAGEITAADLDEVKQIIDQTHRRAESKNWKIYPPHINIDSLGGSVPAAMAIGRLLRKENASARIDPDAVCLSACVLVLAGAVGREMEGKIGIHRPYLEVPKDAVSSDQVRTLLQQTLQDIRAYFREMNVSEQLADAMLRINPENMLVLSPAALNNYGLTSEDPIARETNELKIAQQHGLDRQEYMRRKILSESRCVELSAIRAEIRRQFCWGWWSHRNLPSI